MLFLYRLIFYLITTTYLHHVSCSKFEDLDLDLGSAQGINVQDIDKNFVTQETLQKIMKGIENGNKENMYFYGLLKLYGISLAKDEVVAATYFYKAAVLGYKEAVTAYGVMLMTGVGVKKDNNEAKKWFRNGISLGDMNAHWLLGK